MTARIFRAITAVAALAIAASFAIEFLFMYDYMDDHQHDHMKDQLELAAAAVEAQGVEYLEGLDPERYRLTLVDGSGAVLYDTHADAADMGNHADREEIRQAWATGAGGSSRHSETLTQETLYEAVALGDGRVLRISISRATTVALVLDIIPGVALVAIAALLLSMLMAARMSRRIVEPINNLDLTRPLENDVYREVTPLLSRIHQQNMQLAEQISEQRRRADEFEQITANMQEGLVLLAEGGEIISINPAAAAILQWDGRGIGKPLTGLSEAERMSAALDEARQSGRGELISEIGAMVYRCVFSRIMSGGRMIGVLLLMTDVSEQAKAERARREFSANVSHELKTPLQSIIGSAELMEKGLVQPEDAPRFIARIRREAARLVALIEDIIRLSQLDEGGEMPVEEVEIASVAGEIASSMEVAAAGLGVSVGISGSGRVTGVRRLIHEIVYNLMDNAIKYNNRGGHVQVSVNECADGTLLSVSDTGIGIPKEHQERVFERFYRADKSHSKLIGGTGLGLSIVKHAARYHNARITLRSAPGEGCTVEVFFPRSQQ